jgi:hypothetical protein
MLLVGLLFVQGVYGSNILSGLDEKQQEALKGLYIGVRGGNEPFTRDLTLYDSYIEFGHERYDKKECNGGPGSKFCWSKSNDPGCQLILHDDGTLRKQFNERNKIQLCNLFYKIAFEQADRAIKAEVLEEEVKKKIKEFWPANNDKMETATKKNSL